MNSFISLHPSKVIQLCENYLSERDRQIRIRREILIEKVRKGTIFTLFIPISREKVIEKLKSGSYFGDWHSIERNYKFQEYIEICNLLKSAGMLMDGSHRQTVYVDSKLVSILISTEDNESKDYQS